MIVSPPQDYVAGSSRINLPTTFPRGAQNVSPEARLAMPSIQGGGHPARDVAVYRVSKRDGVSRAVFGCKYPEMRSSAN